MTIVLKDIKDKAKKLLNDSEPYVTRQTGVYDSTKNKIIVAGYTLDGVVSSTLSADTISIQQQGIDYGYTGVHEMLTQRTLTVTVLPTATCLEMVRLLALRQLENKGWFNLSVHENDKIVNVYRAWIIELPEIGMQAEGLDRQITFGLKTMFTSVSLIDQPTSTEQALYSRYGIDPSRGIVNIDDKTVVAENGRVFTILEEGDAGYEPTIDNEKLIDAGSTITPIEPLN